MIVKDMFLRVLTESGQFLIDPDLIELDQDKFVVIVRRSLSIYNRYCPTTRHLFKSITASKQYTFTEVNTPEGIPDYISDIIPMRVSGVMPFFQALRPQLQSNLECKQSFPWDYRQPVLTVPVQAEYDILAVYKHKVTQIPNESGYEVKTIDENDSEGHDLFFDLLTAAFMRGLARSRRAFTLNDLPIETDANELASEATDLERDTKEQLENTKHKFWLAYR